MCEEEFIEELKAKGNKEILCDGEVMGWSTTRQGAEDCFRDLKEGAAQVYIEETDSAFIVTEVPLLTN